MFELARHNTAAWLQSIDHATRINLQGIALCVHWRDACVDAWQNIAKVETAAAWEAGRIGIGIGIGNHTNLLGKFITASSSKTDARDGNGVDASGKDPGA